MAKPRRIAARVALILAFLIGAVALKIVGNELTRLFGVARLYRELVSGTIALLLMIVAGLLIDRSWRDFRDQRFELLPRPVLGPRGLLSGVVIGLSMIAVVFGLAWLIGGIRVRPRSVDLVRWLGLAGFIAIATLINAAWEEYAFRGWPFAGAAKLIPAWAVATLTGVLFGLAHLFSAHASWPAILSVSLAGWLLGFALIDAGSIALPLGIHTGWNLGGSLLTSKLFWIVTLVSLAVDQATKLWIYFNVAEFRPAEGIRGDIIPVVPGFFDLVHAENPGAAFSMFRFLPEWFRVPMFLGFTCVALWVVWDLFRRRLPDEKLVPIALALIASGALGNAVDRVWKATVTDFLRVYISAPGAKQWLMETFGTAEWPSFNVADSTLLVGVVIFVIATWNEEEAPLPVASTPSEPDPEPSPGQG